MAAVEGWIDRLDALLDSLTRRHATDDEIAEAISQFDPEEPR